VAWREVAGCVQQCACFGVSLYPLTQLVVL
jgi:hypothetical protein